MARTGRPRASIFGGEAEKGHLEALEARDEIETREDEEDPGKFGDDHRDQALLLLLQLQLLVLPSTNLELALQSGLLN